MLIADEPTTALDVTIQAQILDLIRELQVRLGLAVILVTHDLGIVAEYADDVTILYAARVMEQAPSAELFNNPLNPYTRGLLESIPGIDGTRHHRLQAIPGIDSERAESAVGMPVSSALPDGDSTSARGSIRRWRRRPRNIMSPASVSNPTAAEDRGTAAVSVAAGALVRTEGLSKEFPAGSLDLLGRKRLVVKAVDGVDLAIRPGETLGWSANRARANRRWGG